MSDKQNSTTVRLSSAKLSLGGRTLWQDLNLEVRAGEFLAVLGPNGSGKTSLLRVLLGLAQLSEGTVEVCGEPPKRGSSLIGYVPQQKSFDTDLPIRGRDIVRLGLDGHKFGLNLLNTSVEKKVDNMIREVGAEQFANAPIGLISGGEQQRLRIAQALLSDPRILLCDEPLLSLDLSHQQAVSELIDERRRKANTSVIFVTHEINPILPMVDRVLYLVGGKWAVGTPQEVLTGEKLSELYGTHIDVLRSHGRVIVVGTSDTAIAEAGGHHHEAHK
jgi:zinc/manganese transport system ATP-binding protein